jgi:tRNA dimethylallyltransferase
MLNILGPREGMNLKRYVERAHDLVKEIRARRRLPILVGGTALYLNGFLRGVMDGAPSDLSFRASLRDEAERLGTIALHQRLESIDPVSAQKIHENDYKRIERALEVHAVTGSPLSLLTGQWKEGVVIPHVTIILTWPRPVLDERISARVDRMFDGGLRSEVEQILQGGGFGRESSQCLGYREMLGVLQGTLTEEEAKTLLKSRTRRFARRQLTWFRSMHDAHWITGAVDESHDALAARVLTHWRETQTP